MEIEDVEAVAIGVDALFAGDGGGSESAAKGCAAMCVGSGPPVLESCSFKLWPSGCVCVWGLSHST